MSFLNALDSLVLSKNSLFITSKIYLLIHFSMKTEVSDANLKTNQTPDTVLAENFEDTTADEQNGNVSMTSIICMIINGRSKCIFHKEIPY